MAGMTDRFELECLLLSGPLGGRRPGAGLSITTIRLFSFRFGRWMRVRGKEGQRLTLIQIVLLSLTPSGVGGTARDVDLV